MATTGDFYQNLQDNLRMPMTPLKADEPGAPLPSDWLATTRAPKFSFSTGSSKFTNISLTNMEMILKGTEGGTFLNDYSYLKFNC